MAEVLLENVKKIFPPDVVAVDDFTLSIADGELIVLLGPSGCGKSTTLHMIAGLEELTSGTIRIGDRVVNDVNPADRNIAMVFQDYALYPHMHVYDNLAFGLKMRKTPKPEIDQRVRAAAETLGIVDLLERKPRALSGGQRQRVAVGRAIVRDPEVFLLDEPLSNLDAKLRVATRAELKELHQRLARTMIYVTHDQTEAMTLADRIVVMRDGLIQQVGTPLEVYDHPANRFVADFIGTPPASFIDGEVTDGEFRAAGVMLRLPRALAKVSGARILAVRPEDVLLRPPSNQGADSGAFDAKVRLLEPLGGEMIVHLEVAGTVVLARLDARAEIKAGETLTFHVRLDRLHLFEREG